MLFLNKYSYVGTETEPENIKFVQDIAAKYDNVVVIYNEDPVFDESAKSDNIGYYYSLAGRYAVEHNLPYIWLVQSDEIYDFENIEKIYDIINCKLVDKYAIIFEALCYIDNPHWCVTPSEELVRPTLVSTSQLQSVNFQYQHLLKLPSDIKFHHLSYVLRRDELLSKFTNWGHRNDVKNPEEFLQKLDKGKINKHLTNLHPIIPNLYPAVQYVDNPINKELYHIWIHDILTRQNPYDQYSSVFSKTICDFPEKPDLMFTLPDSEKRLLSGMLREFLPPNPTIVEYGSWNGFSSLLIKLISPTSTLYAIDNYEIPDVLYGQYDGQLSRVYQLACKKIFDYQLQNIQIFNGASKFLCLFPNLSIDCAFIHPGIDVETTRSAIIEIWPKLKDGAFICGRYGLNEKVKTILKSTIAKGSAVQCPWGIEHFDFYEIYDDILTDLYQDFGLSSTPQYGFWFARVKKQ